MLIVDTGMKAKLRCDKKVGINYEVEFCYEGNLSLALELFEQASVRAARCELRAPTSELRLPTSDFRLGKIRMHIKFQLNIYNTDPIYTS